MVMAGLVPAIHVLPRTAAPVAVAWMPGSSPGMTGIGIVRNQQMQKHFIWVGAIGVLFGLLSAANAQSQSPLAATTQFDGTYAFVSAMRVNETYTVPGSNRIGQCRGRERENRLRPPLTMANGQAQFTDVGSHQFEGTVSSQGELAMRSSTSSSKGGWEGVGTKRMIYGRIDGGGTVRGRNIGYYCRYDLIWQKTSR